MTGSTFAKAILDDWENELRWFIKVMPNDYRRVLEQKAKQREKAVV
jgi:glutamate synthase domain-containing protein 3